MLVDELGKFCAMDETVHASAAIAMKSIDFIMVIGLLYCTKVVAFSVTLICSRSSAIVSQMVTYMNGKANIIGTVRPISLIEFY